MVLRQASSKVHPLGMFKQAPLGDVTAFCISAGDCSGYSQVLGFFFFPKFHNLSQEEAEKDEAPIDLTMPPDHVSKAIYMCLCVCVYYAHLTCIHTHMHVKSTNESGDVYLGPSISNQTSFLSPSVSTRSEVAISVILGH